MSNVVATAPGVMKRQRSLEKSAALNKAAMVA